MCSLLLLPLGLHLEQTHVGPVHAAPVWVFTGTDPVDLEDLAFLVSCPPSPLTYTLSVSSSVGFLSPEEDLMETPCLVFECYKDSHSQGIVWLQVPVFVPICCRRKLLHWWLSKALDLWVSQNVIRSHFYYFIAIIILSRTVVFGFAVDSWAF